jgi:hypothetical protein
MVIFLSVNGKDWCVSLYLQILQLLLFLVLNTDTALSDLDPPRQDPDPTPHKSCKIQCCSLSNQCTQWPEAEQQSQTWASLPDSGLASFHSSVLLSLFFFQSP